jgi:hypothetical protein
MKRAMTALALVAFAASPALAEQNVPPYTPDIGPRQGSWEATLAGSGASLEEFDNNTFGVTGSVGYYVLKWMPVGFRQSIITNFGDEVQDVTAGNSRAYLELQAPLGRFQPFVGVVGGYQYGDGVDDAFLVGPSAGIKLWVSETTFAYAQGEYQITEDSSFDEGNALYQFGMGLTF